MNCPWLKSEFGHGQHWPPRCHKQLSLCSNYTESFEDYFLCVGLPWVGRLMDSNMKDMYQAPEFFTEGSLPWAGPAHTVQRPWKRTINYGDVFCSLTSIHKHYIIGYVAQQVGQGGHFISPLIQCKIMSQKNPRVWWETHFSYKGPKNDFLKIDDLTLY